MGFRRWATGAGLVVVLTTAPLAFAGDYPPASDAQGTVSPSRIKAGECAVFSGSGFQSGAVITVTDNGAARGTSTAQGDGTFSKRLCFGADAAPGRHVLKGTGDAAATAAPASAPPAARQTFFRTAAAEAAQQRTVTAVLYLEGVSQSGPSGTTNSDVTSLPRSDSGGSTSTGASLAFTGFPALLTALAGVVLVGVGSLLLIGSERRHRRRQRLA
ncbi:MAG: hypothetical protein JWL79_892 [Frankiales bacterium]|nr:hypothetical protein [Frankiales bacterium]